MADYTLYNGAYNGPQVDAAIARALAGGAIDVELDALRALISSPATAATAADMTDTNKVYIYTGSEVGYTAGHWYYYDGDSWEDGGVYQAAAADASLSPTSVNPVQNKVVTAALEENRDYALAAFPTATIEDAAIASFDDGADNVPVKELTVKVTPVQSGSGDPSPDNVRPISGWTGANVQRTGKNLFGATLAYLKAKNTSGTWSGDSYTLNGVTFTFDVNAEGYVTAYKTSGMASAQIEFTMLSYSGTPTADNTLPDGSYILSGCPSGGGISTYRLATSVRSGEQVLDNGNGSNPFTIDNANSDHFYYATIVIYNGANATGKVFKPMIRVADASADFAAYVGKKTYTVSWQSEAGTVYGGTLNVTNGLLSIEWKIVTLGSNTTVGPSSIPQDAGYSRYDIGITGTNYKAASAIDVLCSHFKTSSAANRPGVFVNPESTTNTLGLRFSVPTADYPTKDDFAAFLAAQEANGTPVQVCWKVATGSTVQLTPTEVRTLLGNNTIFVDCGDIDTLTYRADPTLYINSKINAVMAAISEL